MKQRWLDLPLGTKIAGLTSFLVVVSILVLTLITVQRERDHFHQELENQANLLLETLPITMRDQLYRMELDELIFIARVVGSTEYIDQLVIFDHQGLILYDSSRPEMSFSRVVEPLGYTLVSQSGSQIYAEWGDGIYVAGKPIMVGNQILGAVAVGISTESMDKKITILTVQSSLLALVTIVVGIGLSSWLGRQISNPLSELVDITAEMAKEDVFIRVKIQSNDEVGQLGKSFNQMTASIQDREIKLRKLAAGLEQSVKERTTELRLQNKQLERIAIEDPLTGIYNRRYFFDLAAKEVERAKRYGNPLSVVILDADNFKTMNDTYGHLIGDQILSNLATLCLDNIRSLDIIARYGGEEFVILMPEASTQDAQKTAERLRKLVAETSMVSGALDVMITISLGVASWENQDRELNFNALLARADQALYQSKEMGKNRVSVWQEN
jgi:diguanylate cyclase (GGDEF)-like protein